MTPNQFREATAQSTSAPITEQDWFDWLNNRSWQVGMERTLTENEMKAQKNTEVKVQDKGIIECYEYFARVTEKQGFVVPFEAFYGDGSRFPLLTRDGVAAVYESSIELWKEYGAI